jgi:hypothetical protein
VSAAARGEPEDWLLRDDRVWERVWESMLGPVERQAIGLAVWRNLPPAEPFQARVAAELTRRWRLRAIGLAVLAVLWTAFWGAITAVDLQADGRLASWLSPALALAGLAGRPRPRRNARAARRRRTPG